MKVKYLAPILFLIIPACKKETGSLLSDLQGTWELRSSDGGWTGHQEYAPGNGNTYSFSGTAYTRQIKTADTTYAYSGTFEIYDEKPCDYATKQTLIEFDDDHFPNSFSLSGGELTIGTTECIVDGGSSTYRKIH